MAQASVPTVLAELSKLVTVYTGEVVVEDMAITGERVKRKAQSFLLLMQNQYSAWVMR